LFNSLLPSMRFSALVEATSPSVMVKPQDPVYGVAFLTPILEAHEFFNAASCRRVWVGVETLRNHVSASVDPTPEKKEGCFVPAYAGLFRGLAWSLLTR